MPRDDLSIDWNRKNMPQVEHQDAAAVLDDFVNRVANLPAEIQFMQEEIADKERQIQICMDAISTRDASIQRWVRLNSSRVANPKEEHLRKIVIENYDRVQILQEEKCALAQKSQRAIDRHIRYLDGHIKALQDRGDFPTDPDIPSLLRPSPIDQITHRASENKASLPTTQINIPSSNGLSNVSRHAGQQNGPQRLLPGQTPQSMNNNMMPSGPASPAAIILNRQAREGSTGAANKRQRLTGGINTTPANSSGLARHPSIGPGTPKAGTPISVRAGSAGPRTSQKSIGGKKIAPHKQGGLVRKGKHPKSGLSRVKRGSGNRNSPSSTNDSELSDAESGTADEEDEAVTPPPTIKRADMDEEMGNAEDDEGSDDKKYCTCQSVSHGDMVACDNDDCPYEWFHWNCVGLKSEPVGSWYCPVCKPKEVERRRKEKEALGA